MWKRENPADRAASQLHSYNEMVIVVANQILGTLGVRGTGRPDDALLGTLEHWARLGHCEDSVARAFETALKD